MKYAIIFVEGTTEWNFVENVLQPHLQRLGLHLTPTIATTRRVPGSSNFKGGIVSFGKVEFEIKQLLRNKNNVFVTTMIDFYNPKITGFPGWATMPRGSCFEKVDYLERQMYTYFNDPRFIPYFSLHEFEALLFADTDKISDTYPELSAETLKTALRVIRDSYLSPEEINLDSPPSKRIQQLIPRYDKVSDGVLIALEIGLERIRAECPHFNEWLMKLEALSEI